MPNPANKTAATKSKEEITHDKKTSTLFKELSECTNMNHAISILLKLHAPQTTINAFQIKMGELKSKSGQGLIVMNNVLKHLDGELREINKFKSN